MNGEGLRKTTLLIVSCIIVTLLCWTLNENTLVDNLSFSNENLRRGYFWVIITALFVHANPPHLVGNMLFLYAFGRTLEEEIGSTKTILAFFLGGALSFILSAFFYEIDVRMIGASAAIFTLMSITMAIKPLKFSWLFLMPLGLVAMIYLLYNTFAITYPGFGEAGVGYLGHVIGFLIGVSLGVSWSRGKWKRNILISIAMLVLYIILVNAASIILKM
ncbi:rhomboid family intramembrane serine protease [Candidatus Bathyarchaeota archaeon]|nr:rhomboid family intramembrane serine protease [Candidatus Bathyarchaeota archaeon]